MYATALFLGLVFLTWAVVRTLMEYRSRAIGELATVADNAGNP
jgi:hypothetical protein